MLDIIIYEDNNVFMKKNVEGVNRALVNCDIEYRIIKFSHYSDKLDDIINQKGTKKIYILDVEMEEVSGLEVASQIREDDDDSIIIFATAYEKYHEYEQRLTDDIVAATKILYRQGILTFTYNHVVYRIPYNSIYYIEKEPLIKRCIIYTTNGKFFISRSINWLENVLEYGFIRTHQSCIVNIDNIKNIDFVSNVITFKNGMSTNLLANKKK